MNSGRRCALVTGAGQRLGRAIAEGLVARGVATAVHYHRSRQGAEEVVRQAEARGVPAVAVAADLTKPEAVDALWQRVTEALGPVDWLVNNASLFEPITAQDTTLEDWMRNHHIHVTAPFLLSRYLAQQPPPDKPGADTADASSGAADAGSADADPTTANGAPASPTPRAIVNMLDYRAVVPKADHFPYTISKAGLVALTQSLAQAFAPSVRVNGIALGNMLPPIDGSEANNPPKFRRTPMKRRGTEAETLECVWFLLSGPAYLTGDIMYLTGGRHLT